jgi:4-aminobutyrate---pyruvate transaminase
LQRRLREFASHPLVGEVRGVGLIAALELVANKEARQPFEGMRVGLHTQYCAQQRGLILRALPGNCIAICPPLVITEGQIDELVEALRGALDDALDFTRRERLLTG